jgi:hypothetical protein
MESVHFMRNKYTRTKAGWKAPKFHGANSHGAIIGGGAQFSSRKYGPTRDCITITTAARYKFRLQKNRRLGSQTGVFMKLFCIFA